MKKFFEIFRAGKYPQGTFTEKDIELLAKNYDPKFCEAPITLDHDQSGPAYGWIEELKAENGVLKALFRDVSGELKELVLTGKYRKVSVEIYKDLEGKGPYLKSVSFLGAAIPQVKGMEPVEFKEGESETYIFETEEPEKPKEEKEQTVKKEEFTTLQEIIKLQNQISDIESRVAHIIDQPNKDDKLVVSLQEKVQELSAQMKKFEESETTRQKTEQELSELKIKVKKNEFEQFLNEQKLTGNLTPAQKDLSLKLFTALDNVKKFDESDCVEEFKKLIKTLPQQVELNEIATKSKQKKEQEEFLDFENASEESLAIYQEVKQLAEKENICFKDALLRLYK
ncbi:MAG TPA: phage protease [Candidatus Gastranaerophilales bacterium]|nr:phage protease [Candidatus Gastranaerophilales bacterium]